MDNAYSFGHPNSPVNEPGQITKVLASTGPERVTTLRTTFHSASVAGFKGNETANSAPLYIGNNATNQTWTVPSGGVINIDPDPSGMAHNWADFYIRGAIGDGIVGKFSQGVTTL